MKVFNIFENKDTGVRYAVKMGWSWPAFFFTGFWLLYHKMWKYFAFLFIGLFVFFFCVAMVVPDAHTYNTISSLVNFLIAIAFGVKGNELLAYHLERNKNCRYIGQVAASKPDYALMQFNKKVY